MNRYPVSELDELPEYFVPLPGAVSPARSAALHPAAGVGTRGWRRGRAAQERGVQSSLNTLLQPLSDALGLLSAVSEEGPAIAFRLWLQGGVGGETLCLFYYVSLYHSA